MEQANRRKMKYLQVSIVLILTLNFGLCQSVGLANYVTTDSRTGSVKESCGGIDRSSLTYSKSQTTNTIYGFLRGYFNINGAKVMKGYLSGNKEEAKAEINSHIGPIFMMVFPFAVGALVTALLAPCLLICCFSKPWCCRSLRFWKADRTEWTGKELNVPLGLSLILVVGLFVIAIIGFLKMSDLKSAYDKSLCARAIVFDDLLNGNYSKDSNLFFTGLQTYQNNLHVFLENFTSLTTSFSTVTSTSGPMKSILNNLGSVVTQLVNLPSGTGKPLNLVYGNPLNVQKPKKTIKSTFPTQLGTVDNPSSLIGVTFQQILGVKKTIDDVGSISDYYLSTSGPSTSQIGAIQNNLQNTINSVYQVDRNMQDQAKQFQSKPYWVTVGSFVSFSLLIVFTIASFLGLIFVGIKKKMAFRFLLYLSILILFCITCLAFALAITSAIGVPIGLFVCDFASTSASNSQNFQQNFNQMLKPNENIAISRCVSADIGDMLNKVSGDSLVKSIGSLSRIITAMTATNYTQKKIDVLQKFSNIQTAINDVMLARKIDIVDNASIAILTKLSQSYQYQCTANAFHQDSWVPSLQQKPQLIPCKIGIGAVADHTTCSMGDDFEKRADGCVGCIDTYGIFKFTDTANAVKNALSIRYKGSNCDEFINDLSNVWSNFYSIKKTMLQPLSSRYQSAQSNVKIGTDSLINDIKPLFQNVIDSLNGVSPELIDPKHGIGAGLNCNLVGEDLDILSHNVCNLLLPRIYVMLIIFGVLSFALLFTLCFMTCTVTRHYDKFMNDGKAQQGDQGYEAKTDQKDEKDTKQQKNTNRKSRERSRRAQKLKSLARSSATSQEQLAPGTQNAISKDKL